MAQYTITYENSTDYTYDITKIEFVGGNIRLKKTALYERLRGMYRFESGSMTADSSDYDNFLVTSGTPTIVNDEERGDVVYLEGSSRLYFPKNFDNGKTGNYTSYTMGTWFKSSNLDEEQAVMGIGSNGFKSRLLLSSGYVYAQEFWGDGSNNYQRIANAGPEEWHHIAIRCKNNGDGTFTYQGLYDGVPIGTEAVVTKDYATSDISGEIGDDYSYSNQFKGYIDDSFVTSEYLTEEEIVDIYNNGLKKFDFNSPTCYLTSGNTDNGFVSLSSFLTESVSDGASLGFRLSEDGSTWKYWDGSAWTEGSSLNSSNTVNDHISDFISSNKKIYVEVSIISDGWHNVELDRNIIGYVASNNRFQIDYNIAGNYTYDDTKIVVDESSARLKYNELSNNVIRYYRMDESSWDGTAGEVKDLSENSFNLTTYNGANTTTGGIIDRAAYFDSSATQYIQGVDDGMPTGNSPRSISFWIKPEVDGIYYVMGYGKNVDYQLFNFVYDNGNMKVEYYGGTDVLTSSAGLIANEWHHCVVVYTGTELIGYIDAVKELTVSRNLDTALNGGYAIGRSPNSTSYEFNGWMDEIAIYDKALTDDEIIEIFNNGNGKYLTHYADDKPTIYLSAGSIDTSVSDFLSMTETVTDLGNVSYRLSNDGSTWKYWDGSSWEVGNTRNEASVISTNISSFTTTNGTIFVEAALESDGNKQVVLHENVVFYNTPPSVNAGTDKTIKDNESFQPFEDSSFSDSDSSVLIADYNINGGSYTNIPQGGFATLNDAVKALNLSGASLTLGGNTVELRISDDTTSASDSISVYVIASEVTVGAFTDDALEQLFSDARFPTGSGGGGIRVEKQEINIDELIKKLIKKMPKLIDFDDKDILKNVDKLNKKLEELEKNISISEYEITNNIKNLEKIIKPEFLNKELAKERKSISEREEKLKKQKAKLKEVLKEALEIQEAKEILKELSKEELINKIIKK